MVKYSERLAEAGIERVSDSYDNASTETANNLSQSRCGSAQSELIQNVAKWDVFNDRRRAQATDTAHLNSCAVA